MQLLFCSTFSYDSQGAAANWAVVKFPCMIAVDEIRIVPPGVKVHSQLHEEHCTGQTSPNKFHIEFFSDERSAAMTTYEHVGSMEYMEGSPNRFHPSSALYSEKLLLSGWFSRITVAVYGGILSEVGMETTNLDLGMKPSLIIHEKPEGRSVYIRGVQDVPPLAKDATDLKPLLDTFPATSDQDFLIGREGKKFPGLDDNLTRRSDNARYRDADEFGLETVHSGFYDRRQQRDEGFDLDVGRNARKSYLDERMDFPVHQRNMPGRQNLLSEHGTDMTYRIDLNERLAYKDKNRPFASNPNQRAHVRHESLDNTDFSKQERHGSKYASYRGDRQNDGGNEGDGFAAQADIQDLRHNLERQRMGKGDMEKEARERNPDWMDGEYEEISDEEIEEERVANLHDLEENDDELLLSPGALISYNPFLMEPSQLVFFNHPEMTEFEITCNTILTRHQISIETNVPMQCEVETEITALENLISKGKSIAPMELFMTEKLKATLKGDKGKEWVQVIEDIIPLVIKILPWLAIAPHDKYNEHTVTLITWSLAGLDHNLNSSQAIGINLRMLKCGINLAHKLCQTTQEIVAYFTEAKLDEKLLRLLQMDNMASSIKIMLIHCLDAYLSWPSALSTYFGTETGKDAPYNDNYARLVQLMLSPQAARVATGLSRLVNKIHLFHMMWKLKTTVHGFVTEKIPNVEDEYDFDDEYMMDDAGSDVVEEEIVLEEEEMMVMSSTSNDEEDDVAPQGVNVHHEPQPVKRTEKHELDFDNQPTHPEKYPEVETVSVPTPNITEHSNIMEDTTVPLDAVIALEDVDLSSQDVEEVVTSLQVIGSILDNSEDLITQAHIRVFPTSLNLAPASKKTTLSTLYRMLEFYQILPSIQALLTLPVVSGIQTVYEEVYSLLELLMSRQDGLLYLVANSKNAICVARHLLSSAPTFSPAELETPGTATHLGIKLAIHIQCIQCIDQLCALSDLGSPAMENAEAREILKILASLSYPSFGRFWVSKILSMGDNVLPIIGCINSVREEDVEKIEEEADEKPKKDKEENEGEGREPAETKKKSARKSAVSGYAIGLLVGLLKTSPNVQYLLNHSEQFIQMAKGAVGNHLLEEVSEWLRPLDKQSDKEEIVQLVEYCKDGFEKLEWNSFMTAGPGLCTVLRLLCHLTEVKNPYSWDRSHTTEKIVPATYSKALQVFSGGGLSVFMTAMEKLCKCFTYSCFSQHSLTSVFSINFQNLIATISENLLMMVDHLLTVLLHTTEGKFQPEQLIKLLVNMYAGVYTLLRETDVARLDIITELVVSVIAHFMRTSCGEGDSEEGDDTRTKILTELILNIQEHCEFLVPGTILLSQILPLPLPVIVDFELDNDAVATIVTMRKQWEKCVTSVLQPLTSFVSVLCYSTCLPLLEALIPLIQQVIDLSPEISSSIIAAMLNACVLPIEKTVENTDDSDPTEGVEIKFAAQPIRVLSKVAMLPAAKATLMDYIRADENNRVGKMWEASLEKARDKNFNLLEATTGLATVLLDSSIYFVDVEENDPLILHHIEEVVRMAVEGLYSSSLETIFCCLQCLSFAVLEKDGFACTKTEMANHPTVFNEILNCILLSWDDNTDSSLQVLYQFCLLIGRFSNAQSRSQHFSKRELKSLLKWSNELENHPLLTLKSKLESTDPASDLFSYMLDEVTALCHSLKHSHGSEKRSKNTRDDHKELKHPVKELLLVDQFNQRPVWVYGVDDSITFESRLGILHGNVENSFVGRKLKDEEIVVDLVDMAEKFCAGFNLENSLKELTESAKTADVDKIRMEAKAKKLKKLEAFSTRHGKTLTYMKRSHGLQNMSTRGRGRGRGGPSSGRHYDLFRQRKQNTSRPPSMHVDDFMAADEKDQDFPTPPQPPPPPPPFMTSRRTQRPFKRDFMPRGRGARGSSRIGGPGRGGFGGFAASGNGAGGPGYDKFRNKNNRSQERFPRGRGRGRDSNRSSFSPRDNFKNKPQPPWSPFSPRNVVFGSGGFRGGRGNKMMRLARPPMHPPTPLSMMKWGIPPPPRRGRGYGKPRGKHIRSFTR